MRADVRFSGAPDPKGPTALLARDGEIALNGSEHVASEQRQARPGQPHRRTIAAPAIGVAFGRWTVTGECWSDGKKRRVPCDCACGTKADIPLYDLADGKTTGCITCLRSQNGSLGISQSPEYSAWRMMQRRCYEPTHDSFKYYGGRGITVHQEWRHDFAAFLAHVGPKPTPRHTLDRINTNGNYEPGNVKWSTPTEQTANRRKRTQTELQALCIRTGLDRRTVRKLSARGVPPEAMKANAGICHCSKCGSQGHQARTCPTKHTQVSKV